MTHTVRVAAYQAPLLGPGSPEGVELVREAVRSCEARGVDILCCPEAMVGGLADYTADPRPFALDTQADHLQHAFAPIESVSVTTIIGFTEAAADGLLYNSAAVLDRRTVLGVYRKHHPAINRSVYAPGHETPVFRVHDLTFGIIICNDSNFPEPARAMVGMGATVLFVPTNNSLPADKTYPELVAAARRVDIARATEHRIWIVRADVAGCAAGLVSDGSSAIVDPHGTVIRSGRYRRDDLLIAEIEV